VPKVLAVVFWNSRNARSSDTKYEDALAGFHQELNQQKPKGVRRSVSFRVCSKLPWINSEFPIYEDWYIMTNFAALDSLDQLVLEDKHLVSHRDLMVQTGCASGAVMYLDKGTPYVERSRIAYWFSKPREKSLEDIAAMADGTESAKTFSIWTRSMALGPTGNCLVVNRAIDIPPAYGATETIREVFWAP